MAVRRPLVLVGGKPAALPPGDVLPGADAFFSAVTVVAEAAGQTEFEVPGGYVPGALWVFLNGSCLAPANYTADDGEVIVLNSGVGVVVGSELIVLKFAPFEVADALPLLGTAYDSSRYAGLLPPPSDGKQYALKDGAWVEVAAGGATYESPEQYVTVGGALTLSHGLGAKPKFLAGAYVCKTAEAGYSVGDEAYDALTYAYTDAGVSVTTTAGCDATNIYVVFQNALGKFRIRHKTSGVLVTVTPGNWRYIVRARL